MIPGTTRRASASLLLIIPGTGGSNDCFGFEEQNVVFIVCRVDYMLYHYTNAGAEPG